MATAYTSVRKKNAGVIAKEAALDVNSTSSVTGKVDTVGVSSVTLQVVGVTGSHATHVVKLQGSVDGTTFVDTASTVTGAGAVTLSGPVYPYHRAKVTTAEGSAATADVYIFTKL